jgi:1-carboxybiuret hydrolase subunit AtzG-like
MKRKMERRAKPSRAKTATGRNRNKRFAKASRALGKSAGSKRAIRTARPAKPGDAIDTLVTANAQALGITLEPAWRPGVAFNLGLIFRMAALFDRFALPEDAEPGPVFHA